MSGRLVILPHKSWNVWNQDNREKVARDERLHREAEEAKAAKDKQLLQEQNLELLRDGEVAVVPAGDNNSGSQLEPFRLFDDLEKQHYARLGNEDFLKEKAQKELLQKKRDGIADWALGEGSVENSKVKPWYETLGMGESVSSSSGARSGRESSRKDRADPMGTILMPNTHEYQPKPQSASSTGNRFSDWSFLENAGAAKLDSIESKEQEESSDSERSHEKKKRHKERKEDRTSKRRSKHKRNDSSEDEKSHKKSKKSKHPTGAKVKIEGAAKTTHDPWAELRAKRLEREAVEKKRAAVLLATVDVYGPGGASSSSRDAAQGYGQQYHPHLARHKR